jgi:hypothetical protein
MEGKIEKFIAHVKEYVETRADLLALNVQDKLSDVISSMVSALILGFLTIVILFFLSIGSAWWLGQVLGSPSIGFFCIAGIYALIGILIYLFRKQWIKMPMINFLIKKINLREED